jgi:hypothetical protein
VPPHDMTRARDGYVGSAMPERTISKASTSKFHGTLWWFLPGFQALENPRSRLAPSMPRHNGGIWSRCHPTRDGCFIKWRFRSRFDRRTTAGGRAAAAARRADDAILCRQRNDAIEPPANALFARGSLPEGHGAPRGGILFHQYAGRRVPRGHGAFAVIAQMRMLPKPPNAQSRTRTTSTRPRTPPRPAPPYRL